MDLRSIEYRDNTDECVLCHSDLIKSPKVTARHSL
jgi:hypothetical protein